MIDLIAGIGILVLFLKKVGGTLVKRHHQRHPHASGKGDRAT